MSGTLVSQRVHGLESPEVSNLRVITSGSCPGTHKTARADACEIRPGLQARTSKYVPTYPVFVRNKVRITSYLRLNDNSLLLPADQSKLENEVEFQNYHRRTRKRLEKR